MADKNKSEVIGKLYDKARFMIDDAINEGYYTRKEAIDDFGENVFNRSATIAKAIRDGATMQSAKASVAEMASNAKANLAEAKAKKQARLAARKGAQDMRVGGMVKSTIDNRKYK